jgi:hypothetical protein
MNDRRKSKMVLAYETPTESHPMRTQKIAAAITVGCGAFMVIAVRVFSDFHPGKNLPALFVLVAGLACVTIGGVWYLACRKSEELS